MPLGGAGLFQTDRVSRFMQNERFSRVKFSSCWFNQRFFREIMKTYMKGKNTTEPIDG